MNNIFKKLKILVFFLLFSVVFYFGVIPRVINTEKNRQQIRTMLETSLKTPVKFGKIDSEVTWNLGLKINADKIFICHENHSCFASAGSASFELSLLHLLFHRIKIRKINIKKLNFTVIRLKNGEFDIKGIFSGQHKVRVNLENAELSASDYKIFFVDEYLPQKKSFFIEGEKFKISDFNSAKNFEIDIKGRMLCPNRSSTYFDVHYLSELPFNEKQRLKNNMSLKGKIQNLYLDMYLPYFQRYFPDYSSLSGVVNSNFDINLHKSDFWSDDFRFNIKVRDFAAKKPTKGEVLKSLGLLEIDVFAKRKKEKLLLEKLTVKSPNIDIKLNGEVGKVDSKNPHWDLKLFVKNTKIEAISYLFPEEIKVPYNMFEYFRRFKVKSNASGEVDIQGIGKHLDLYGGLKFTGFSATRNSQKISDGIIKVNFDGKINYIDADVWGKPNEHLYIKGTIIPQSDKISLSVKAQSIEFGPFTELLFAIRDIMKFNLGHFVSNSTIVGKGDSDIYVYGDPSNHYLYGYLKFSDCTLDYSGLSQPFEHVVGKVKFYEDDVYYNNIKAFIMKSHVVINGKTIRTKVDLIVDAPKLNAAETRKLINESHDLLPTKEAIKNMKAIAGYFVAKLTFGNDKNNDFIFKKLKLDAWRGASVTYEEIGFPIKIIKGSILITDKETLFKEVQSEAFGVPAKISGQIIYNSKNKTTQNYIVNFKNFPAEKIHEFEISPIISEQVKDIFRKFQNSKGYLDADLEFLSQGVFADVRFNDTDFVYVPLNLPARIKNGRLIINPKNMQFESLNANIANSPIYINGSLNNYQTEPAFENFILDIPKATSVELFNNIFANKFKKPLFKGGSLGGMLKFQGPASSLNPLGNLEFNDVALGNVTINHALLRSDSDGFNLQDSDVQVAGQKFKVSAIADKNFNSPFKINKIKISAHKIDVENFMECFKKSSNDFSQMTSPITIEDGVICVDELIWKNLCATNFSSSLCLDENGLLGLPNLQLNALNGCIKGNVSYNLKNTELAGNLSATGLPVSSLANFFKVSPNEISGNLSCCAEFCTHGKNKSEIIQNTNARVDFNVANGFLKKFGKAQYLLMAKSAVKSGIGNITINKLLNVIFPENLGSFETFGGTIIARDGSLMSNNMVLKSQNLCLLASGDFNMKNKKSSVILLGQLPKETKKIGVLGDISPGVIFVAIPGVGFLPGGLRLLGLTGLLPLFNPKSSENCKQFVVRMLKTNHNQDSFGSFEWFDKLSEREKDSFCFEK